MTYTTKCNWGWKIYDKECESIDEACEHTKKILRILADSGPNGSGYISSQLPRLDAELDRIKETGYGTISVIPDNNESTWMIKKKSSWW